MTRGGWGFVPWVALAVSWGATVTPVHARQQAVDPEALPDMSLEQLADLDVTSVSRRSEPRFTAPAAVFVLEGEDIRRSGVTNLADALRLIPGVHVARLNSNQWSVGIRGFGTRLSRSVLVLIDGRSVYNPLYAGTYWELQDLLLEDVERIELVRGPGGTLWGANAFNGVINIVTHSAEATKGVLATATAGTEERASVGVRRGAALGERGAYRFYAKLFERDGGYLASGGGFDDWRMARLGTRVDLRLGSKDVLTTQGDIYYGRAGMRVNQTSYEPPFSTPLEGDSKLSGGNVIGRWQRQLSPDSELHLQGYYDRRNRLDPNFEEIRDTFDLDLDHRFPLGDSNDVTWGLGYRVTRGRTTSHSPQLGFSPPDRTDHLVQGFLQDSLHLWSDRLRFLVGSKIEHNGFTGVEIQPSARAAILPTERLTLWAAVSRAVRTPSAVEHNLEATIYQPNAMSAVPTFRRLAARQEFRSETVIAYEAGVRVRPWARLDLALSTFYNRFDNLLSVESGMPDTEDVPPPTRLVTPIYIRNGLEGRTAGLELAYDLSPSDWVRIQGYYAFLDLDLRPKPGSNDATTATTTEGSSPQHQAVLRLGLALPARLRLDVTGRLVGELPALQVERYLEADVTLAFRPWQHLELAVVGQNLVEAHHFEGAAALAATQVQRGVYGKVTWQW